MNRIALLVTVLVLTICQSLPAITPDEVSAKTHLAAGFCALPRGTTANQPLATALAGNGKFVVHVQVADAATAAKLRNDDAAKPLLGQSLYVETGSAAALPFADRMVDLLIVDDLNDADLTPQIMAEWTRVLSPLRGTALVGRAKSAGPGLSAEALRNWAKALPLVEVSSDDSGIWALLHVEPPAGSDQWTHRCHGAENSQVSTDSSLKTPFITQWWGLPRQEGFWGTSVVTDRSRMFTMRASRNRNEHVFLTARSLTNGLVLWQHELIQADEKDKNKTPHGGYMPGRSAMAVSGDWLYLIEKDSVARIDGETGQERSRIAGPKKDGQVKWIACPAGLLAVLAGEEDVVQPITYQTVSGTPRGRDLAVYEPATGKQLWHETLAGNVDERMIAVRDDRIYCLVEGQGMVCHDLHTGKVIWVNPDSDLQNDFQSPDSKKLGEMLFSQPGLMALDDVLLLRSRWSKNTYSLSRADGATLWKAPAINGSRAVTAVAYDGMWISEKGALDLKTGKAAQGPRFVSSGCGPTTAIPGLLITCFGRVADVASGKRFRADDVKSPCDVGSIIAEGILLTVPSECSCGFPIKGYRALTGAGKITPHTAGPWKDRLTTLDAAEPKPLALTAADWPTYRHDAQRSAASGATIGDQVKLQWRWTPAGAVAYKTTWPATGGPRLAADFISTAPVAAGDKVYFASPDGVIRCISAGDGKELWNYPTGAMVFAPPTIWNGRVLVGGGDGRAYCLDAASGRCLWTFLAAPMERRIFWFGHMVSTWPIIGGITVDNGIAYLVAGFQEENGVHAYALDARSGSVIWEKDDCGSGGPAGLCSFGNTAVGAGKLWICAASTRPAAFECSSGNFKPGSRYDGQFGCEIAVLNGNWVVEGGRRLTDMQDTFNRPLYGTTFNAYGVDAETVKVSLADVGTALPAWDADMMLMPSRNFSGALTALPTAKFLEMLGERLAPAPASAPAKPVRPKPFDVADAKLWTSEAIAPAAFALAKDQAVIVYQTAASYKVSGLHRTDGSKGWTIDLPEQPAMNHLAIDRDGRILIGLCDGSIMCVGK